MNKNTCQVCLEKANKLIDTYCYDFSDAENPKQDANTRMSACQSCISKALAKDLTPDAKVELNRLHLRPRQYEIALKSDLYLRDLICRRLKSIQAQKISVARPNKAINKTRDEKDRLRNKILRDFNPVELYEKVRKEVIGQDEAIKVACEAILDHQLYLHGIIKNKPNFLLIGPSGNGKTEIIRAISKHIKVPMAVINAASISATGYVGDSVRSKLFALINEAGKDIPKAEKGIVVLDEIDKLNIPLDIRKGAMSELLVVVEGTEVILNEKNPGGPKLNTKDILFIGAGAFQSITENKTKTNISLNKKDTTSKKKVIGTNDIIKSGISTELLRRFPQVVEINALSPEDMKNIILNAPKSPINDLKSKIEFFGGSLDIGDNFISYVANNAPKLNLGASAIVSVVKKLTVGRLLDVTQLSGRITLDLDDNNEVIFVSSANKSGQELSFEEDNQTYLDHK